MVALLREASSPSSVDARLKSSVNPWDNEEPVSIYFGTNTRIEHAQNSTEERDGKIFIVSTIAGGSYNLFEHFLDSDARQEPWERIFFLRAKRLTKSHEMSPFLEKITEMVWDSNFQKCDRFLSRIDAKELSNPLLTGILRLTYNYRDSLPHWQPLRQSVESELRERGLDVVKKLRGL